MEKRKKKKEPRTKLKKRLHLSDSARDEISQMVNDDVTHRTAVMAQARIDAATMALAGQSKSRMNLSDLETQLMMDMGNFCMIITHCTKDEHDWHVNDEQRFLCKRCGYETQNFSKSLREKNKVDDVVISANKLLLKLLKEKEEFERRMASSKQLFTQRYLRFRNKFTQICDRNNIELYL